MEVVTQSAIDLALDGVVDLIEWEIHNVASQEELHGLVRAIEIVKELKECFSVKMSKSKNA